MEELTKLFLSASDDDSMKSPPMRYLTDPYQAFGLSQSSRPSTFQYHLQIEDARIQQITKHLSSNSNSFQRITKHLIRKYSHFTQKTVSDNHWCSSDDLNPLNTICTKWCTTCYFPDASSRVNMIMNMSTLYQKVAENMNGSFNIVFKGGVMVRLLIREFLKDISTHHAQRLTNYLEKHNALSMSDLDFEIVPKNHSLSNDVAQNMVNVNFAVLLLIKQKLQDDMKSRNRVLNINWNKQDKLNELKYALQNAIDDMESDNMMHGCRIDAVTFAGDPVPEELYTTKDKKQHFYRTKSGARTAPKRFDAVVFVCDDTRCVTNATTFFDFLRLPLGYHDSAMPLYATLNTYVGEGETACREGHLTSMFHLARIKHGFNVYYTTKLNEKRIDRLSGEMVDLSQSCGTRYDFKRRLLYATLKDPYMNYPILGVNTAYMRSFTPFGFFLDHHIMLYHSEDQVWNSNKADKRLVRYLMFLMICTFHSFKDVPFEVKKFELQQVIRSTQSVQILSSSRFTFTITILQTFVDTLKNAIASAREGNIRSSASFLKSVHAHLKKIVECSVHGNRWTSNMIREAVIWHDEHTPKKIQTSKQTR